MLSQFSCILAYAKKFIHPGQVNIKFINTCFFKQRNFGSNDFCYPSGIFTVLATAGIGNNGMRTKLHRFLHRHGRMDAEFSGFITAGSHHTSFISAYQTGFPFSEGLFMISTETKKESRSKWAIWCKIRPQMNTN